MAWRLKWYDGIREAQQAPKPKGPLAPFDLKPFVETRLKQTAKRILFRRILPGAFAVMRRVCPNPRFGRLIVVTRADDVREVLADADTFEVPFGLEMAEAAGGKAVLGIDGKDHARVRPIIDEVIDRTGDLDRLAKWTEDYARALVDAAPGRIDVIGDLMTRTATETCTRFLGLTLDDPDGFARWTTGLSMLIFADPTGDPAVRALALNASARLRDVIDEAIRQAHGMTVPRVPGHAPLVDRLIREGLSDEDVRANLMAIATGLVPTLTIAAGNILEELFHSPRLYDRAVTAARERDLPALRAALLEAARRNPALVPGQWRYVAQDGTIAAGTRRERAAPKDSIVLVATQSALRDSREPRDGEWLGAELMFGVGNHGCVGRHIAMAQIERLFLVLLSLPDLRRGGWRHGWIQRAGVYPVRCDMTFTASASPQAMVIVAAPVTRGTQRATIEEAIDALGNPAREPMRDALTATGLVHFASLSVIEDAPGSLDSIVLFELNVDGPRETALAAVAEAAFALLHPVFRHTTDAPLNDAQDMTRLLSRHCLDLHCRPWGPIGIHFNGTPEFSVARIARERELATFVRAELRDYLQAHLGVRNRAMAALRHVRRSVKQDARGQDGRLLGLPYAIVKPAAVRLALTDWRKPASFWHPFWPLLKSRDGLRIVGVAFVVWAGALAISLRAQAPIWPGLAHWLWSVAAGMLVASGVTLAAIATVVLAFLWRLRRGETTDVPDTIPASADHIAAVTAREDARDQRQNHIVAAMPLKPGPARKAILAFALWGIAQSIRFWFRPGFVTTIGTIHYAKWFRVPGTDQFVFLANYDGSWESYLEDFITRARWGQTAGWSSGKGFPRTRWLVFDGAADGDGFKRWVRKQQRPTLFWYSRFPDLTAAMIRNNALIADGLARGATDTDARRWLACFGSAQREETVLESADVQSILFGGFSSAPCSACLLIRLPTDPKAQRDWLGKLTDEEHVDDPDFLESVEPALGRVTFGDHAAGDGAVVLGLSARGLATLGLPGPDEADGLGLFPPAFATGMAARRHRLGDPKTEWDWSDDPANGADAMLIVHARTARGRDARAAAQAAFLARSGGSVIATIPTDPVEGPDGRSLRYEHFGYRDGISQPVIRGTERAARAVPERDIVAAGEFILGYRNNQGYRAGAIGVRAESDPYRTLAVIADGGADSFPRFGDAEAIQGLRDFGRNGAFLAVRQLDQDVEGFDAALEETATALRKDYPNLANVTGFAPTAAWVAAKVMGRWRDGTPLVGNPREPKKAPHHPDNAFSYGADDPQGLQCPLGAHIRRANPRDSLQPGSIEEQAITNRHRLLRRGRSYDYGQRRGLLFMALCADLERQFEFVQRTWLRSGAFHGLIGESDPILGGNADACPYTIPTVAGPMTIPGVRSHVSVRAGGYFFLPSRSAFRYLVTMDFT